MNFWLIFQSIAYPLGRLNPSPWFFCSIPTTHLSPNFFFSSFPTSIASLSHSSPYFFLNFFFLLFSLFSTQNPTLISLLLFFLFFFLSFFFLSFFLSFFPFPIPHWLHHFHVIASDAIANLQESDDAPSYPFFSLYISFLPFFFCFFSYLPPPLLTTLPYPWTPKVKLTFFSNFHNDNLLIFIYLFI